jgi:hypothetical protein
MITLRPQDIVVLLKLSLTSEAASKPLARLGGDVGISAAEFHGALNRTAAAGLLDLEQRRPRVSPLLEFLEHGIRYVFISRRGEITRGIPTAHSAEPLKSLVRGHGPAAKIHDQSDRPYHPLAQMHEQMQGASESPSVRGPLTLFWEQAQTQIVWSHPEGEVWGEGLEPLYPSIIEAARRDPKLHEYLALVDALRIGRARERKLAIELLTKGLLGS